MGDSRPSPSPPDGRARVCLLCTCGLPGAGKSTLARRIAARAVAAGDVARADVVSFDDVEREVRLETARARGTTRDAARGFDAQAWRDSRKLALSRVDALLASDDDADASDGVGRGRRLVIADDNFYYASMRYQAHQLARRARAAHVQLYVNVPVELARARNERRAANEIVPRVAFDRMANAFEPPDPRKRTFELPTVRIDDADADDDRYDRYDDDDDDNRDAHDAWGLVWDAWGAPPRLPITEEEREALRMKGMDANARSAVHALDLRSRRALGDAMRRVSSAAGGPGRRADASVALNAARKEMLDAVRERSKGKKGRGGEQAGMEDEFEALDLASFVMAREDAFAELCEGFGGDGGAGGA